MTSLYTHDAIIRSQYFMHQELLVAHLFHCSSVLGSEQITSDFDFVHCGTLDWSIVYLGVSLPWTQSFTYWSQPCIQSSLLVIILSGNTLVRGLLVYTHDGKPWRPTYNGATFLNFVISECLSLYFVLSEIFTVFRF